MSPITFEIFEPSADVLAFESLAAGLEPIAEVEMLAAADAGEPGGRLLLEAGLVQAGDRHEVDRCHPLTELCTARGRVRTVRGTRRPPTHGTRALDAVGRVNEPAEPTLPQAVGPEKAKSGPGPILIR